jgi:tight adherence protein B
MMSVAGITEIYRWASVLMIALALFGIAWAATIDESSIVWRQWTRYTVGLERKLRPMFIWTPGRIIGLGQFAGAFLVLVVHVLIDVPFWYLILVLIAIGPALQIELMRRQRVEAIERQLDGFLLALANALKSTPSIGAAFQSVAPILQPPIRQEIDLAIKEMKVGSTLDQSLLHMAARVGSRQLDSALSSILIGRQVGGNLPKVLETTSATLREMARLDGVIRTKTAEGKFQLYIIAVMPLGLSFVFNWGFPGYLQTLTASITGYIILFAAGGLWLSALLLARKVLSIDI